MLVLRMVLLLPTKQTNKQTSKKAGIIQYVNSEQNVYEKFEATCDIASCFCCFYFISFYYFATLSENFLIRPICQKNGIFRGAFWGKRF